jgi:hypothetical protein
VACVRAHTKPCCTCHDHAGKLLPQYRRHGPTKPGGRRKRCADQHPHEGKQVICSTCGNERVVCALPGMGPACGRTS